MASKKDIPSFLVPGAEPLYGSEERTSRVVRVEDSMPIADVLSNRLYELRTELEYSHRDLAEVAGLSLSAVLRAEAEPHRSGMDTIAKMSNGLGTTLEGLLLEASASSSGVPDQLIESGRDALQAALVVRHGAFPTPSHFQDGFANVLREQKEQEELRIQDICDNAGLSTGAYKHAVSGNYPEQSVGIVLKLAGAFEEASPQELIARASARSAGFELTDDVSDDPRERDVAQVLREIRRNTSGRR